MERAVLTGTIDRYCAAWNEPDAGRRAEILAAVWSEGATYTDPTVHATGAAELLAHIGKVRAAIPAENDDAPLIDDTRSFLAKVQAEDDEAGWSKIPLAEPQAPMTSGEWKARTMCSDGACNGVIENGACSVCGRPAATRAGE